jgi:hypothetical protein
MRKWPLADFRISIGEIAGSLELFDIDRDVHQVRMRAVQARFQIPNVGWLEGEYAGRRSPSDARGSGRRSCPKIASIGDAPEIGGASLSCVAGERLWKPPGRDTDPVSFLIVHLGLREQRAPAAPPILPETFDGSFRFFSDADYRISHDALLSWPDENLSG